MRDCKGAAEGGCLEVASEAGSGNEESRIGSKMRI